MKPFLLLPLVLGLNGCATIPEVVKPDFKFRGIRVEGLNTKALALNVDFDVLNRMSIPLGIAGLDYNLQIDGKPLFTNETKKAMKVPGSGKGRISVPVTLHYRNLAKAFKDLKEKDDFAYDFACGVSLDVPIAGDTRIPFQHAGKLPVVLPPLVKIKGMQVKKLSWPHADLALDLEVENPNKFRWALKHMNYSLKVNEREWVSLNAKSPLDLESKTSGKLLVPFKMDFSELGKTVFDLLTLDTPLTYSMTGKLDLNSDLPLMRKVSFPLNHLGELTLLDEKGNPRGALVPFVEQPSLIRGINPGKPPGIFPGIQP